MHHHPTASHGPVMSNLHQPGTPMSLVPGGGGGGGSQHFGYGQPSAFRMTQCGSGGGYGQGGGTSGSGANQDRPFKCDQCPQSFNRNHDLKRHKRIHLPVKPFPCGVCEKSFSRKDALKLQRHRLVKECGGKTGAKVMKVEMVEGQGGGGGDGQGVY
ncbi:zinc-finger double domain-containing protein [Podospora conica]|nr:zinc-finger double domain-containing protein [Schizothecium conicum]